jgi:type VI secretion system protein ImpI
MPLTLQLVNETTLPDGGPVSYHITGKRGIDIGRDSHLDWTLPDPTRYISGKHCEIRYRDGGYWLHDVSTNGTFLNGSEFRMPGPHRLRHGDRFTIGPYIVAVTIEGEDRATDAGNNATAAQQPQSRDFWNDVGDTAPPLDPLQLRTPRERPRPIHPDFLDWAADVPHTSHGETSARPEAEHRRSGADGDWASGPTSSGLPSREPPASVPTPRRPGSVAEGAGHPWDQAPSVAAKPTSAASTPGPLEGGSLAAADFVRRFARGAGIPDQVLAHRDPEDLAEHLGFLMRLVTENLMQLLKARIEAKQAARSASQTTIQALDNNPLKFSPSAEEALRTMLGPPNKGYLDAPRALQQGFEDLKAHQVQTFSAMQHALRLLLADLDPQTIEKEAGSDFGLAAMVGSRKAKLWDNYVARWQTKARGADDGLLEAFMLYFAESYDRSGNVIRHRK